MHKQTIDMLTELSTPHNMSSSMTMMPVLSLPADTPRGSMLQTYVRKALSGLRLTHIAKTSV